MFGTICTRKNKKEESAWPCLSEASAEEPNLSGQTSKRNQKVGVSHFPVRSCNRMSVHCHVQTYEFASLSPCLLQYSETIKLNRRNSDITIIIIIMPNFS